MIEGDWTISGAPASAEVETRLRNCRRYVTATRNMLAREFEAAETPRQRTTGPTGHVVIDEQRASEIEAEFPRLAWSSTLTYCLTALELYLRQVTRAAAHLHDTEPVAVARGPKIDGWLAQLATFGVRPRLQATLMDELAALRRVRNAVTHDDGLSSGALPEEMEAVIARWRRDGLLVPWHGGPVAAEVPPLWPTEKLVTSCLETVELVVARVDFALHEAIERHRRWPGN